MQIGNRDHRSIVIKINIGGGKMDAPGPRTKNIRNLLLIIKLERRILTGDAMHDSHRLFIY